MPALKTERRVFLWRIHPETSPAEAATRTNLTGDKVTPTLDEWVSILEAAHGAGVARVYLSGAGKILDEDDDDDLKEIDEKNQVYVADIQRDPATGTVSLLINRGDPNIVSPAFIDTDKGTVRTAPPREHEVPGASAHLVVQLQKSSGSHRACFEQMPHVSSSLVMAALDHIVSRALVKNPTYKYEVITKGKGGKKIVSWKTYRPIMAHKRTPSDRLLDDLEVGQLSSITLTKRKTYYAGPGVKDLISRQEEKVVVSLKPAEKGVVAEFVSNLVKKAKEEAYESVSFDIQDLPGKASARPTLSLDDEEAMEQLYVRSQRISGFANILEQCYPVICDEIRDKMVEMIQNGHW